MTKKYREPFTMCVTAAQGAGKTVETVRFAKEYTETLQRPVVVFDTNEESIYRDWEEVKLVDVPGLSGSGLYRVRPVDQFGNEVSMDDKVRVLEYLLEYFFNGLLIAEDFNNYAIGARTKKLISLIINKRHRNQDQIFHFQTMRALDRRFWGNTDFIRMHKQSETLSQLKNKIPSYEYKRVAELIIEREFKQGNKYISLLVGNIRHCILGASMHQIRVATREYLNENMTEVKQTIYPKLKIKKDSPTAREKALNHFLEQKNNFQPYF